MNKTLDIFQFVEPCEPDCSPERHAYHKGQWDLAVRMHKQFNTETNPGGDILPGVIGKVGEFSDGYHTFNELYAYRMAYNALLFNEWFKAGKNDVHWSRKHSTGEDCFGGGWFVVVAQTPSGQITNHYELKDLQWFVAIEERERAAEWDGHTPAEAFDRLRKEAWTFSIPF